jgi:alpha-beta hydrolase superfamily lysophospholipase
MSNYTEELVSVESEDGILHAGAVIRPAARAVTPFAVVWVHGLTGSFCEPHALRIGRGLAAAGHTFITGNNRGHDVGIWIRPRDGERRLAGGAWEAFDESPQDVGAWITYAVSLGFPGVVLIGHSLGSLKVAYYQAQRQDARVVGLVAASPPVGAGRMDPDLVARVTAMVAEGRGEELIVTGGPTPRLFSAQTYLGRRRTNLDVYGFHTPTPAIERIRCPILALYGTNEPMVGTAAELQTIKRNAIGAPRVDTAMIEGADHVYTGRETDVVNVLSEWLATI